MTKQSYLQRSHVGDPHENGPLFDVVSEVTRHFEDGDKAVACRVNVASNRRALVAIII